MNEIPRDLQVRIELAREAKDVLENRAIVASVEVLKKQCVAEWAGDNVSMERMYELRADYRSLERIMQMLRSLMAVPPRGPNVR